MSAPLPPEIILPTGQRAYLNPYRGTYTTSRSYAVRMQNAFARGLTQSEARGHRIITTTEGRQFTEGYWRSLQRRFITPINKRVWKKAPSREMNIVNGVRKDPRIFRSDILAVIDRFERGYRDPAVPGATTWDQWVEWRLSSRLASLDDRQLGKTDWESRSHFWPQGGTFIGGNLIAVTPPPIEYWFYH